MFFLIPIILTSLLQSLYVICDAVIIGNYAGKNALGSIEAVLFLTRLPFTFAIGVGGGISILVSKYFGAKNFEKLKAVSYIGLRVSFVMGAILAIVFSLSSSSLLSLLNVPDEIKQLSSIYVTIYFLALPITLLFNCSMGILRAVGDSKSPFYNLLVANIINVVLDILFVGYFDMSVRGAAIATAIGQVIGLFLSLQKIRMDKLSGFDGKQDKKVMIKEILNIGVPLGFQSSLYTIANIITSGFINVFGVVSITAWAISGKIDVLVWIVSDAIGLGVATFVAQNVGAENPKRIKKGVKISFILSTGIVMLIGVILFFFNRELGSLVLNDKEVLDELYRIEMLFAPFYFVYAISEIFLGGLKGFGKTKAAMLITLFTTSIYRVTWLLIVKNDTLVQLLVIFPISWLLCTLVSAFWYFKTIKNFKFKEIK